MARKKSMVQSAVAFIFAGAQPCAALRKRLCANRSSAMYATWVCGVRDAASSDPPAKETGHGV